MSRNRIVLFGVLGVFLVGLALGIFGRGLIPPSEETKYMNQLMKEELKRQKQVKEDAVANVIIMKLRSAKATLLIFSIQEKTKMEDYDLGAALNSKERIREKLGDIYADGHWVFQSKEKKWWIGYKLDGVSEADRQKLVQRASSSELYKSVNEDDGVYDGGDIVFMPI